jgi:serine/threonine protein phosphatase PrpC
MGATFVALLVHDGHYACVWAGDSRAYLLRRGVLTQISHDHSVVQDLIDAGVLDEASRRRHPSAHVVTRAVGAGETLLLEQRFARVLPEDVYLLCSDGLTCCLDDREIAEILQGGPLEASIDQLVRAALLRGAPDNVTVLGITASGAWG